MDSREFVLEPLEPRLLLSADSIFGAVQGAEPAVMNATDPTVLSARLLEDSTPAILTIQQEPTRMASTAAAQTQLRHEVVFVDTRVDGYRQFLKDFLAQTNSERLIEVHVLDAARDGIEQVSQALAAYRNLDAVHFISHGTDGAVQLGATWLDPNSLNAMADSIAGWGASLNAEADLLFYGCDLAASPGGAAFIEELGRLTDADVAASVNRTGTGSLGGDWVLEHAVGKIEAAIAASGALQTSWLGVLVAPTATNLSAAETYTEDTPLDLTDIVITDVDSPNVNARLTLSDPAAGSLNTATSGSVTSTYDPVTGVWSANGAIADVNALLANLTFTPALNYNADFTIATSVDDGVAPALTGVKNMTGIAVNDAPTASNLNASETYALLTPLNLADIVVSDVDSPDLTVRLTLSNPSAGRLNTGTSGAVTSTYNVATGVWTASGAIADLNVLLANLTYTPNLLFLGNFTISTHVDDGVAPPLTGVKHVSMALINLPPNATNLSAPETYTEDTPLDLKNIVISDLDSPNVTARLTLSNPAAGSLSTATSGSVTSTYNAVTGVWSASGAIADVNALLASLTFTPGLNYSANFTIATRVDDGVAAAITGTKTMTAIPVNDAPTASNLSAAETYTENQPLNLADIVISDVDMGNVTATLTLSDVSAGSLSTATSGSVTSTYNAVTGIWRASGALADVNALLAGVRFIPALNYNSNFTIATSVDDGVAPALTGVKDMTGVPVNSAPTATNLNAAEVYTEDTPLDLTDIVVNDVDSPNATVTLTLSDPAAGTLSTGSSGSVTSTYNAAAGVWTASGAIADVNALLASLRFTPALDYNGNFTIATSVDDGVAPAITGVKNMTGIAVNDAPVLVNNALAISEGGAVVISGSDLSATDVDSAVPSLTFSVSNVTGGQFELLSNPGVAITTFTQAQVTSGVVRFVHDGGEAAPSYSVTVSDGSLSDGPAQAAIIFTNVNSAPAATNLGAAETYTEDIPLDLTDIVASDVDSANVTATLTLSNPAAGNLNTGTSGSVTSTYNAAAGVWAASGAIADVNALLASLRFIPALNYNGNFTIVTSVDDSVAPAITGVKNITGVAVNDAPVLVNNAITISEGGSVVFSSAELSASDVDSAGGSLTFAVSGVRGGQFELLSNPGVAITSFTEAQVTSGTVRFVHDGGGVAPSYSVTVSDGNLSQGPAPAAVTFNPSVGTDAPDTVTPPPDTNAPAPVGQPAPGAGPGPAETPTPASGPITTGPVEAEKSSPLESELVQNEFQPVVNTVDILDATSLTPEPSRMIHQPTNERQEWLTANSDTPLITPNLELERTPTGRLGSGDLSSIIDVKGFVQGLNQLRNKVAETTHLEKIVVGSSLTAASGLSIGYVLWLLRGEVLLTSLLTSLPAWRLVDPLPVLSFLGKRSDEDEDDDSIEATVKKGSEVPQSSPLPKRQGGLRSVKWRMVMQPADSFSENSL